MPSRVIYHHGPEMRVTLARESGPALAGPATWDKPEHAAEALYRIVHDDGCERFGVCLLSTRHKPIGVATVSVGCLTTTLVHPREVFAPAIVGKAAAVLVWHTHPSGDPEPSAEDLALTRRLVAGGNLLGIEVLDHIVLGMGTGRWVSCKERGVL